MLTAASLIRQEPRFYYRQRRQENMRKRAKQQETSQDTPGERKETNRPATNERHERPKNQKQYQTIQVNGQNETSRLYKQK